MHVKVKEKLRAWSDVNHGSTTERSKRFVAVMFGCSVLFLFEKELSYRYLTAQLYFVILCVTTEESIWQRKRERTLNKQGSPATSSRIVTFVATMNESHESIEF